MCFSHLAFQFISISKIQRFNGVLKAGSLKNILQFLFYEKENIVSFGKKTDSDEYSKYP
jgi:hypothetical protein